MKSNKKIMDCDLFVSTIENFIRGLTKRLQTYFHRKALQIPSFDEVAKMFLFNFYNAAVEYQFLFETFE